MSNGLSLSEINLIDIFGYLLPGTILLAGIVTPVDVTILFPELPSIAGLSLIAVFAFVVSISVSYVIPIRRLIWVSQQFSTRYDHHFARDLFQAQEQYPKTFTEDAHTDPDYFDYRVWLVCRDTFDLPNTLSRPKFDELWYGILSYLETTPHTRAFRMQALYTFSRNMAGVSLTLAVFYGVLIADSVVGIATATAVLTPSISGSLLVGLLLLGLASTGLFAHMAAMFRSNWHLYAKMEFFVDQQLTRK